ncbi:MAG: aminoglycoside phosphotransferase family protein, partial [Caldilineaceae bacterium]|nr:aminoglycoside phosphotransferase family protein [Caldilineaceae bacterium]
MHNDEIQLEGGNVNTVVRVGDTVRRGLTPNSATVHRLLLHLQDRGFDGCPRFLGIDEQNREILSFIDGETGILPSIWQSDEALIATAQMLRRYHDATVDFAPAGDAMWAYRHPDPERSEVICHNDFAPYNFVYEDGVPVAVLDFDLAGPGPRIKDVAYAAYWTVPLSFNSADQVDFA